MNATRVYDLLLDLEWQYHEAEDFMFCPSCGNDMEDGHTLDCELREVMDELAEEL